MTNREKYIDNASNKALAEQMIKLVRADLTLGWTDTRDSIMKWLSQEVELTADEMFEELGYAVPSQELCSVVYRNIDKNNVKIRLYKNVHEV